jgi:hypothetical protein
MSEGHQGLYPIVRRKRRPLIPTDAGMAAPAVVPAKSTEVAPAKPQEPKAETKRNATPTETNE